MTLRPTLLSLVFGLLLSACGADTDDTGAPDSDSDADSDTDADADSDTDADADSDADADATFVFDITGSWEGTTLGFTRIVPGEKMVTTYEDLFTTPVDGATFGVEVDDPPPSTLFTNPDYPDQSVGVWLPDLFIDANSDGVHQEDEVYVGAAGVWGIWMEGTMPAEYTKLGFVDGWNGMHINTADGSIQWADRSAMPLPAAQEQLSIGGTVDAALDTDGVGLAIVSLLRFKGDASVEPIYDEPLVVDGEGRWQIDLDGPPPANHLVFSKDMGTTLAQEIPFGFLDTAEAGYDGENPAYGACYGAGPSVLLYLPTSTDVSSMALFAVMGWHVGWSLMTISDPPVMLDAAQALDLEISASCTF
jgi:hypothetical protein